MKELASRAGVEFQQLSLEVIEALRVSPQAQRRTAHFKKAVYIVKNIIFKGPYKNSDRGLMNNLRHTYAIELLEDILELEEKKRSTLKWEYIGYDGNGKYYLVSQNVGNWQDICTERVTTKIETNVEVAHRGTMVSRVSEIEGNNSLTDDIKVACLQHLYLRFLLDIGDSGTHNILVRKDGDNGGRLIAGIDLEEKRKIAEKKRPLDYLFHILSKKQATIYESYLGKIESVKYSQINQKVKNELGAIKIDLERLRENIELWESITMSER